MLGGTDLGGDDALGELVLAPAADGPVREHHRRVAFARRYLHRRNLERSRTDVRRHVRLAEEVAAPADDVTIIEHRRGVKDAHRELDHGTMNAGFQNVVRRAPDHEVGPGIELGGITRDHRRRNQDAAREQDGAARHDATEAMEKRRSFLRCRRLRHDPSLRTGRRRKRNRRTNDEKILRIRSDARRGPVRRGSCVAGRAECRAARGTSRRSAVRSRRPVRPARPRVSGRSTASPCLPRRRSPAASP